MSVSILTHDDLQQFKAELITELRSLFHPESPTTKRWLKTEEVKKLLKVSSSTLQTLRINGTLQYTKIGGIIYYDNDYLSGIMQENLRPSRRH